MPSQLRAGVPPLLPQHRLGAAPPNKKSNPSRSILKIPRTPQQAGQDGQWIRVKPDETKKAVEGKSGESGPSVMDAAKLRSVLDMSGREEDIDQE